MDVHFSHCINSSSIGKIFKTKSIVAVDVVLVKECVAVYSTVFDITPNCNLPFHCKHVSIVKLQHTWYTSDLWMCYGFAEYRPRQVFNLDIEYKDYSKLDRVVYAKITNADTSETATGWMLRSTISAFDQEQFNVTQLVTIDADWHHALVYNTSYHIHLNFIKAIFLGYKYNNPVTDKCEVNLDLFRFKPGASALLVGEGVFDARALNPMLKNYNMFDASFYQATKRKPSPIVIPIAHIGVVDGTLAFIEKMIQNVLDSLADIAEELFLNIVKLFGEVQKIILTTITDILNDDNFKNSFRELTVTFFKVSQEFIIFLDSTFPLFEILVLSLYIHYKFKSLYITLVSSLLVFSVIPIAERSFTVISLVRDYIKIFTIEFFQHHDTDEL